MTAPTPDLPPEARAAIEQVLALHKKLAGVCESCGEKDPCPTRTILSALLPPPEPTIEVTDDMALQLRASLAWKYTLDEAHRIAEGLIAAGLCPAAWLPAPPEDERVRELREAAAGFCSPGWSVRNRDRLRAALQAWDEPT